MYDIQLKTTKATEKFIKEQPVEFHKAVVEGFGKAVLMIEGKVKKGFGTRGRPKVRTGHLRRSVYSRVIERGPRIAGIVGSDVRYAQIQEEGGVIRAKNSKFLRFTIGDRWVTIEKVTIPARPYIEPVIRENLTQIGSIISDTVKQKMENL